jgi:shikimate kinase
MNITLIGMPASGKTFIGRRVAGHFGLELVDPDKLIEQEYDLPLQQVLEQLGDAAFITKEAAVTLSRAQGAEQKLFSTGGSIVYSEHVMEYLKGHSHIVYLKVPIETLTARIDGTPRGIVGADKKTLEEIFAERSALYEKWAMSTVDADRPPEEVAAAIVTAITQALASQETLRTIAAEYEKTLDIPDEKPMHPFLLCPVGIVGAGKTTVVKPLSKRLGLVRISRDEIRGMLKAAGLGYERLDDLSFPLVRKYASLGYSVAIDSDCASEKTQKLVAEVAAHDNLRSVWIHINPPEEFILAKLRNFKHTWLFKDADEAIANYTARKPLHEHLDMPFVYTFDTSKENLPEQLDEAVAKIRALVD